MHLFLFVSFFLFGWVMSASSFSSYIKMNPNGANVHNVNAIGHKDVDGGGPLNVYGKAFGEASHKWTSTLCLEDSDGDGQSNGLELGDPCCAWVEASGSPPSFTADISDPGIASSMTARRMPVACFPTPAPSAIPMNSPQASASAIPMNSSATSEPLYTRDSLDMTIGLATGIPAVILFLFATVLIRVCRIGSTTTHKGNTLLATYSSLNDEAI